jgi:alkylation response protein AidB-like acyl-CoA dehydrogenase
MDFDFSESQNIILHSARTFLEKEVKGLARKAEGTEAGYSPEAWHKMAELGWLGVVLPEQFGGIEGSFLDLTLLLEEAGKYLFPGPLIPAILSGLCINGYGRASQKEEFLPGLIRGELIICPACVEPDPALSEKGVREEVKKANDRYFFSGTRLFVPYAHVANYLLYCAELEKAKTIFLIPTNSPGVTIRPLESIACDKLCEVKLQQVEIPEENLLGKVGLGDEILRKINAWGALAESAYITGMLAQVLTMTVEYAKERQQFEKKIGSFQAIQHQCADMATDIDRMKFLTYQAALRLSQDLPSQKEISMAKALASEASRRVSLLGVKIHGGMGVSEEHDMQLYFRRAKAAEQAFGDADFHREIVATELGL